MVFLSRLYGDGTLVPEELLQFLELFAVLRYKIEQLFL